MLERLKAAGLAPARFRRVEGGPFAGEVIVFTGTLENITRDAAKVRAQQAGAQVGSSITRKTTIVVAGDKAGSKRKKAEELKIPVLSEAEFLERLG
jgi:DNA ligase (NAD+)